MRRTLSNFFPTILKSVKHFMAIGFLGFFTVSCDSTLFFQELDTALKIGAPSIILNGYNPVENGAYTDDFSFQLEAPGNVLSSDPNKQYIKLYFKINSKTSLSCGEGSLYNLELKPKIIVSKMDLSIRVIACNGEGGISKELIQNFKYKAPVIDVGTPQTLRNPLPPILEHTSTEIKNFGSFKNNFQLTLKYPDSSVSSSLYRIYYAMNSQLALSCSSGATYAQPILVNSSVQSVRAITCSSDGSAKSAEVSMVFNYDNVAPAGQVQFSSPTASFNNSVLLGLSHADSNADIFYSVGSSANCSATLYVAPINVTSTQTISAVACDKLKNRGDLRQETYTKTVTTIIVPPPAANPKSKNFGASGLSVSLTSSSATNNSGYFIRYALNSTVNLSSCSKGTAYSSALAIPSQATSNLRAIGCDASGNKSAEISETYTRDLTPPPGPVLSHQNRSYRELFYATISSAEAGSYIRYSLDGTVPSSCANGSLYSSPIEISGTTRRLRAIACDAEGNMSAAAAADYLFDITPPTLVVKTPAGNALVTVDFIFSGDCETGNNVLVAFGAKNLSVNCSNSNFSTSIAIADLVLGNNELSLNQTDSVGNLSVRKHVVIKDIVRRSFAEAQVVLRKCIACHGAGGAASSKSFEFANEAAAFSSPWFKPGNIESLGLLRTRGSAIGKSRSIATMPTSSVSWTQAEYQILEDWVMGAKVGDGELGVGGPVCDASSETAQTDNPRLTKHQLIKTLTALFGSSMVDSVASDLALLPADSEVWNFDRTKISSIKEQHLEVFVKIASVLSENIWNNTTARNATFGTCASATSVKTSCLDVYLSGFSLRLLRRPLSTNEKNKIKSIYTAAGSAKEGFVRMLGYQLLHPYFHIRWELGSSNEGSDTEFKLTAYEVASRLAFSLTDQGPDSELISKASDGSILNESTLRAQASRLMGTAAAKEKFKDFAFYWMRADLNFNFSELPSELVSGIDTTKLGDAAIEETRKFMEYMIWDGQKKFSDLLSSQDSFASNAQLASIYGHNPVSGSNRATFAGRRKGVFGRLPFLFSSSPRTALIRRSLNFRDRVLCDEIKGPNADVFLMRDDFKIPDTEAQTLSNRDFIATITRSEGCMSCHASINPTGNVFEGYDSLGRPRTTEKVFNSNKVVVNNVAVDTADSVPLGALGSFYSQDYSELIPLIVESEAAQGCFAQKLVSFSSGRTMSPDESCRAQRVYNVLRQPGSNLIDAIVETVANETILNKRVAP